MIDGLTIIILAAAILAGFLTYVGGKIVNRLWWLFLEWWAEYNKKAPD
jgi:hypothetical protein